MRIGLTVDTYYEYFLTILGWIINNNIWSLLTQSGFFALPFVFYIIGLFLKVREQGDDEGNKGRLLVAWLENAIYVGLFVMVFTCMPIFTVSYSTLELNTNRMMMCGYTAYKPSDTPLAGLSSELSGKETQLPLWWAFTYTMGKGATHGAIAALPCKPDLRQIRFEVQNTQITSPLLRQEVMDFVEQCFIPARTKIKRQQIELDEVQARDLDWIGSRIMLNTNGLYNTYRSKSPRAYWAYDANRDAGLPNTGEGGFPSCKNWWSDNGIGLKARLLQQVEPDLLTKVRALWNSPDDYTDIIVRSVVRPQNLKASSGRVYGGYGGTVAAPHLTGGLDRGVFDPIKSGATYIFSTFGSVISAPAFETIRQALPMVQGFVLLAITIALPFIMVISGYSIKVMIVVTFAQFSVFFMSFWWELARWLDTWLYSALYLSDTHSSWNWAGIQNEFDDSILGLVSNTLFLLLPTLWLGMMGWAGVRVGNSLGASLTNASNTTKDSVKSGQQPIQKRLL